MEVSKINNPSSRIVLGGGISVIYNLPNSSKDVYMHGVTRLVPGKSAVSNTNSRGM